MLVSGYVGMTSLMSVIILAIKINYLKLLNLDLMYFILIVFLNLTLGVNCKNIGIKWFKTAFLICKFE